MLEGIFALFILVADIWAIVSIVGSTATTGSKVLWVLLVIVLPVVGLLIWYFAGPRSAASSAHAV